MTIAATAAVGLVAGLASANNAGAAPASSKLAPGVSTSQHALSKTAKSLKGTKPATLPKGVPTTGRYAFLLRLDDKATSTVYNSTKKAKGTASAKSAAKSQLRSVTAAQNKVISDLPAKTNVIYRTHALMSAVAVVTDVKNYTKLTGLGNVTAVYPIAPKTASNSYAVPLQGAPQAWTAYGDLGQDATVAIIDTGVDYTHANFNGPGTVAAYQDAKAHDAEPVNPAYYDPAKFAGGNVGFYDFAGDSYNADPAAGNAYQPVAHPDPNPLDCNSHGSHVAGTVAGYGENADGSTYTGRYNKKTPFDKLRIGPGMAPKATLYAYKVFGCAGSTNVVSDAIDKAMDPNGDGDTSDHADVVNMSLGSDFGSPQDGDSVETNLASQAGITMVIASGNGGDLYDVGGSPGDAVRSIAVANSQDAYSQVDALHVGTPVNQDFGAERSIAYDWTTKPDLVGDVAQLTQPGNLDGCDPVTEPYKSQIAGKIAFVEWTDDDSNRRCGSAARGLILRQAGAKGFIYANDEESFAAGITGDTDIPGVLVAKSGADAIRAQLVAGQTVHIDGTTANGFAQFDESLNDTVNTSSSRGIRDAGNVKPDVTAVGTSVFSTGMGTGNQGLNDTGTSMATPMVAGTAALVVSKHKDNPAGASDWNPEQVKADIMNTADADLYAGTDHTGKKYAPNRVGAGRIDVKKAVDNEVLAYNADDAGAVSVSFGPIAVTGDEVVTKTKTVTVQNTGTEPASYDVSYKARTTIPGVSYTTSESSITVGAGKSKTFDVTVRIDPAKLTKTIDPTVDRVQGGNPRQYVADASGLVELNGDGVPSLRVPVYSAPRPASAMTQPATLDLPSGAVAKTFLPLSGQSVDQGSGADAVQSIVAGFELQAKSGALPNCANNQATGCVAFSDEKSSDLKYVGATSSAPQLDAVGENPLTSGNGLVYFAISTQGPWRTAASSQEFDIYIDGTGDGVADAVLFNTRLTGSDVLVTELVDLTTGAVLDVEGINDSLGDTDTAVFDSDTLVMPLAIGAIPGVTADKSRITYSVLSFNGYQSDPFDQVGDVAADGKLVNPMSLDVLHPGVAVYGSYTGNSSPLLFADSPGSVLAIRRDTAAYNADKGLGALIVHFHNVVGNKAQLVSFTKVAPKATLALSPNPLTIGQPVTATVTVSGTSGPPTGTATVKCGTTTIGTGPVVNGVAKVTYTPKSTGKYGCQATYSGDGAYNAATSSTVKLVVKKDHRHGAATAPARTPRR